MKKNDLNGVPELKDLVKDTPIYRKRLTKYYLDNHQTYRNLGRKLTMSDYSVRNFLFEDVLLKASTLYKIKKFLDEVGY